MPFSLKKIFLKIATVIFFSTVITTTVFCTETWTSRQLFSQTALEENAREVSPLSEDELLNALFEEEEKEGLGTPENALEENPSEEEELEIEKTSSLKAKMPQGSSFYMVLKKHGLDQSEIYKLIQSAKKVHDISMVPGGTPYELKFQGDYFAGLDYEVDKKHVVSIEKEDGQYIAKILPIDFEAKTIIKGTVIQDNLYNAIIKMGEKPTLVSEITEIFAWDINFFKDLKKGDSLKVVLEKKYRDGKFVKYGRLLGAQIDTGGEKITAIYFPEKGDYFTPEGKSLKKQFLKAPLKYSKITSGFSHQRFHPILKKRTPHLSVDYAAPAGTLVYAVADGNISFAGNSGPSGNLVRINHNGEYNTAYCHLSGFARGLKAGTNVRQGQMIGTVGMTGRTTGPHLCFHLRRNGVPINPLQFKSPKATPVPDSQWDAFVEIRKEVLESLASEAMGNLSS